MNINDLTEQQLNTLAALRQGCEKLEEIIATIDGKLHDGWVEELARALK